MIDYHVSVTDKSLEAYKEVQPGDFVISLRSFEGGIEFSSYHGICSPAYVILRKRGRLSEMFYRQHFKSHDFIRQLTRNLEGLRDGKMISYKQFSELKLLKPTLPEQEQIADCLDTADALLAAQGRKLAALRAHKKGLMQQLFPQEGECRPRLRFPEFDKAGDWEATPLSKLVGTLDAGVSVNSGDRPAMSGELGVLKTSAVTSGVFEPNQNKVVLDKEQIRRVKEPVRADTVIISRMNTPALVGANAYVKDDYPNIFLPDRLWAAKPRPGAYMRFIALVLGSDVGRAALANLAGGSSDSMKNIAKPRVFELLVMVPSLSEQRRIADCLTSLDDLMALEARKLDALKTHKKGLTQQLFPRGEGAGA